MCTLTYQHSGNRWFQQSRYCHAQYKGEPHIVGSDVHRFMVV